MKMLSRNMHQLSIDMQRWLDELPDSCQPRPWLNRQSLDIATQAFYTRRYLLKMMFFSTVITVHRPLFLPHSSQQQSHLMPPVVKEASRSLALDATYNVTQLAAESYHHGIDDALPVTALTLLCPAIFMHLISMKSPDADIRNRALLSFRVCMRIMERLRVLYPASDATINYLETAIGKSSASANAWPSIASIFQFNKHDQADIMGFLDHTPPPQADEPEIIAPRDAGFAGLEEALAHSPYSGVSEVSYEMYPIDIDVQAICQDFGMDGEIMFIDPIVGLEFDGRAADGSVNPWPL